jgi:hypothetical protein
MFSLRGYCGKASVVLDFGIIRSNLSGTELHRFILSTSELGCLGLRKIKDIMALKKFQVILSVGEST